MVLHGTVKRLAGLMKNLRNGCVAQYLHRESGQLVLWCNPQAFQQQRLVSSPQIHAYYLFNGPMVAECGIWLPSSNGFMPLKMEIINNQAPRDWNYVFHIPRELSESITSAHWNWLKIPWNLQFREELMVLNFWILSSATYLTNEWLEKTLLKS